MNNLTCAICHQETDWHDLLYIDGLGHVCRACDQAFADDLARYRADKIRALKGEKA